MSDPSKSISLAAPEHDAGPRRSLILAGGGMRVAYQAGVLKALEELGYTFAHGDGASGGTMNLAMLLSGLSPDEMCDRWRTLDVHKFNAAMPLGQYLQPWNMTGIASSRGIRQDVFPHLGIDVAAVNRSTGMVGTFNVCNFSRKTAEVVSSQGLTLDLLIAGISLPIFMPAVLIDGDWYTDAVWIKDANLMTAIDQGSDELWVVWCIGNTHQYLSGAFYQYVHMIEMAGNGRLFEEFKQIAALERPIKIHVIKPRYPLPLDPAFFLGQITATTLIEMGYADTYRYVETEMQTEGVSLTPAATRMREPAAGVTFSLSMKGKITGRPDGSAIQLDLTTRILDLAAFLRGDESVLETSGNISSCFGDLIPLIHVAWNQSTLVYRFRHADYEYLLNGKPSGSRSRSTSRLAISTLPFALTRVKDGVVETIGSGTLRMGLFGLFKVLRTVHATNVGTVSGKFLILFRFGVTYVCRLVTD